MSDRESQSSIDPLEATAYLTRSEHRLRLLEALSTRPYSRRDLVEATDASSATVGRVLNELQSWGWAERIQDGYVATPAGTQLVNEFQPFNRTVATILKLGDTIEWIPTDELSIGLHHFENATVRRPDRNDPAEVTEFFLDLLEETSTFRALTHLVPIQAKEEMLLDRVQSRGLTLSVVFTDDLYEYLYEHPNHRRRWKAIIEAGANVSRYDARIPCNLFIFDEILLLSESRPTDGNPYECLVIENPTVLSWARELVDRYHAESSPVDADSLEVEPTQEVRQSAGMGQTEDGEEDRDSARN